MPGTVAFAIPAVWMWHSNHWNLEYPLGLLVLAGGGVRRNEV